MKREDILPGRHAQAKGKKFALQRSNYTFVTLVWNRHLEFIQLLSPLSESNTVRGLKYFLHLYFLLFVTYDNVTVWGTKHITASEVL